jgi:magnesium-transporting ATPase (P-type)
LYWFLPGKYEYCLDLTSARFLENMSIARVGRWYWIYTLVGAFDSMTSRATSMVNVRIWISWLGSISLQLLVVQSNCISYYSYWTGSRLYDIEISTIQGSATNLLLLFVMFTCISTIVSWLLTVGLLATNTIPVLVLIGSKTSNRLLYYLSVLSLQESLWEPVDYTPRGTFFYEYTTGRAVSLTSQDVCNIWKSGY